VVTIRLCFSVLIFGLLLSTLFQAEQIGRSLNIPCSSTGEIGKGKTCDLSEAGEATESEDDSPQETQDGYIVYRVPVSDVESRRLHASMNESPPSILLVSLLIHPPSASS
jgi:hypothetical protein